MVRSCDGSPCARLLANVLRTTYELVPETQLAGGASCNVGTSCNSGISMANHDVSRAQSAPCTGPCPSLGRCMSLPLSALPDVGGRVVSGSRPCSGNGVPLDQGSSTAPTISQQGSDASSSTWWQVRGLKPLRQSSVGNQALPCHHTPASFSSSKGGSLRRRDSGKGDQLARLAFIQYHHRVRGMMLPRCMDVTLPPQDSGVAKAVPDSRIEVMPPGATTPSRLNRLLSDADDDTRNERDQGPSEVLDSEEVEPADDDLDGPADNPSSSAMAAGEAPSAAASLHLRNKPPHWHDALRCWCLNFRGRVKLASVKNCQLVASPKSRGGIVDAGGNDGSMVLVQFGKVDEDLYVLDYDPSVITALQAFAVALTTFESKLLL